MSSLFIVRHAQASFMADDYDQLSIIGELQSQLLGKDWASRSLRFDRVCTGPRVRQNDTVKFVSKAYQHAGLSFPEVEVMPEFDEYPAETIMKRSLTILLESDQRVRDLNASFVRAVEVNERHFTFQRLFEYIIAEWVCGKLCLEGVETWLEFCSRVNFGLDKFLSGGGRAERIAIFTSAGPVAVTLQRALHLSQKQTLQMSWTTRNSAWSEFIYSKEKFTLSGYNSHSHLVHSSHLTYR